MNRRSAQVDVTLPPTEAKGCEETLPSSDLGTDPGVFPEAPGLSLGEAIGKGGMGIVRRGCQLAMRRDVAVKSARLERGRDAERAIVREARVTGALEHPGIVPIHTIGRDDDGRPLIVMRRIDGVSWSTLLKDPKHPMLPADPAEKHRKHLEILIQVCNVVRFAHSRGVVHRDLKPSNVMVGEFGEVYVVDWGLAATYDGRDWHGLPEANECDHVVGTPGYMPPELADPSTFPVDERTDVYLLGAILHQVLTGQTRHEGSMLHQLLQAVRSEPCLYDDTVSPDLARVANQATARHPKDRFQNVLELQRAIEQALRRESSRELTRAAHRRLQDLERLLNVNAPDPVQIRTAFIECRFGYQQALRIWENNPEARAGMRMALTRMAHHEIDSQAPAAAEALVQELVDPDPDLLARLERLASRQKAHTERVARLERMRRNIDVRSGQRERSVLMMLVGVAWLVNNLLWAALARLELFTASYGTFMVVNAAFALFLSLAVRQLRGALGNATNRRLIWILYMTIVAIGVHWVGGWAAGADFTRSLIELSLLKAVVCVLIAVAIDRRVGGAAVSFVLAYGLGTMAPHLALEITGIGGCVAYGWMALVWRPCGEKQVDGDPAASGLLCQLRLPQGSEISRWG